MCLVIGFALSFSIQFCNHNEFSDPWKAFVKTVAMMIGEFDYGEIFDNSNVERKGGSPTYRVTFVFFAILTSIVLMNLMISLTVNDIHKLKQEGHARKFKKQAEFLTQIEQFIKKMNVRFHWPFISDLIERFQIKETVTLNASEKFLMTMKFSSKIRGALLEIAQSKRIKNLRSQDSNRDASFEQ
jgi:hypothetical protein